MSGDFDERAATWDDDTEWVEQVGEVAEVVRATIPLEPTMRVLEYGAGTGLLSQHLVADIGPLTLADPSKGMREVLAAKRAAGVFPGARVSDLDLARDPVPQQRYDLVLMMMALHHVPDPAPVLVGFGQLLTDGGWVGIVDLEREDGSFHDPGFEGHHGFDRDQLTTWLTDAGFDGVVFRHAVTLSRDERDYPVFLATARRTATPGR
ncbi:MAG: class I SAM-dependent DNA methyltransferase [Nitriliruptoraceae bacterium]